MIQAGQEIGAKGQFFSNPQVDWIKGDAELREFYKKIFNIHNNYNSLKSGTISDVWKSGDDIIAYLRSYENEKAVVVINFNSNQATSILNIPFNNGDTLNDEISGETFIVSDSSNFKIIIPAYGSRILVLKL